MFTTSALVGVTQQRTNAPMPRQIANGTSTHEAIA